MKKLQRLAQGVVLLLTGMLTLSAPAATLFSSSDADINFIVEDSFGGELALFASLSDLHSGDTLVQVDFNIVIPPFGGSPGLLAANVPLATGTTFLLGLSLDGGANWLEDSGFSGGNTGVVSFDSGTAQIDIIAIDVQVIPVPASVWLFGTGLFGLVAVARRQS